ncbi:hypothetical protein U2453_29340, partial [Klebsiella pneumoniae]
MGFHPALSGDDARRQCEARVHEERRSRHQQQDPVDIGTHRSDRQDDGDCIAQRATSDITHEDPGPREIERQEASEYGQGSTGARPSATTMAWLAAIPLMPSMKFQMLINEAVNTSTSPASNQLPPCTLTRAASSAAAMKCTSRRRMAGNGRWSSHQPMPATSTRPRLATSRLGVDSGQTHIAAPAV